MANIRPLGDRVLIEAVPAETTTTGGIVIPDSANNEKPSQGKVLAVGPGRHVDGKTIPLQVKTGEKVLFGKYAGTNIKLADKEYLVMREEDIMGVIE